METKYATEARTETLHRVTIDHVHIPFGEMVILLAKLALAVVPAALIVTLAGGTAWVIFLMLAGAMR